MVGIIDYGAGNLKSVANALNFVNAKFKILDKADEILNCDKIILPGVGAFGDAMIKLRAKNLDEAIINFIKSGKYFLGICLGMQLLFEKSTEFGEFDGLGILKGEIIKFDKTKFKTDLKIPHVGWNTAHFKKQMPINCGLKEFEYFYFVHSYHIISDESIVLATTNYGYEFISAINYENIFAFQPHPEKSAESGIKIIKNFVEL